MKNFLTKIENNKIKIFGVIAIVLIILFAISLSPKRLQNDTFYTVTIGKLISENGIDYQDHFSWHEGLPYTYPHWLYDLGMYFIFNQGGWDAIYVSTCILTVILGICIYKVNEKLTKNKIGAFAITIAVLYLMKSYIAARAQLVTFILFILLLYNIEKFLETKKSRYALALFVIHVLIANLHVAVWPFTFVLYLPYIAEYLIAVLSDVVLYKKVQILFLKLKIRILKKQLNKIKVQDKIEETNIKIQNLNDKLELTKQKALRIKEKREKEEPYKIIMKRNNNTIWLIIVMLIATLTGFLTPLGKTPFTYTYLTMIGNTMKNINEHLPLTLINNIPMLCTITVVLATLTFSKAKIRLSDLFMLGGLTYLMFSTRRQQSMFVLIGSVAFTRVVTDLIKTTFDVNAEEITKKIFNKFTAFVIIIGVIYISINGFKDRKDEKYISESTYPVKASEWILSNLDVDNIRLFNEYNYGSYLLYKGIPVFVDSRADLYAPEFNTPTGDKKDGQDIFSDFINSSNIGTYYGDIFKKYDITHVIVYKNSKISMLIRKADSEKYKEIYSDDYFAIYKVLDY